MFALFVGAALIALASWAIRTRRINRLTPLGRFLREITDPVILPVERWLLRRGGNPQAAPWWLFIIVLVGGIVLISAAGWIVGQLSVAARAATSPRGILRLVIYYAGQLLLIALVIRVIGSWFGAGRYNRWIRWTYGLTDWIIVPLRRIIPPLGVIDITPIVAWFGITLLLRVVLSLI